MRKTSVYLSDEESDRLARLADEEGKSQAEIIRRAIASYAPCDPPKRVFSMAGCARGDGTSAADVPEEEYLRGFGRDALAALQRSQR
ncbi:MAG: CopG family transcriptional regulator [Dehalococcoidia bacterium]